MKILLNKMFIVGSLASEFLGWSWKTHNGIPMSNIGIPTYVVHPRDSEAREPTITLKNKNATLYFSSSDLNIKINWLFIN